MRDPKDTPSAYNSPALHSDRPALHSGVVIEVKIRLSVPIPQLSFHGWLRGRERDRRAVLGHDIPRPRLTLAGAAYLLLYLGLPVLVLGNLLDLFVQAVFGWCVGVWCLFAS